MTSVPIAPSACSTAVTAARMDSSSLTSRASVLQPAASRSAIDSGRRAVAQTFMPRPASRSAVARPMPVEQPVIRTGPLDMLEASPPRCAGSSAVAHEQRLRAAADPAALVVGDALGQPDPVHARDRVDADPLALGRAQQV